MINIILRPEALSQLAPYTGQVSEAVAQDGAGILMYVENISI